MKKELKFEELTLDQKLGMVLCTNVHSRLSENEYDKVLEMIKERRLGAVYVSLIAPNKEEILKKINETADYPILVVTMAEAGFEKYKFPPIRSLGATNYNEDFAYAYGRVIGTEIRQAGINVLNGPVIDMSNVSMRHIGTNPEKVGALACASVRGLHDAGVLAIVKHYPGPGDATIDSHMQEGRNDRSYDEWINTDFVPYQMLMDEGLLDGIMPGHRILACVDDKLPASISKKAMDVLRDKGWDGLSMTDALNMMGLVLKYGQEDPSGLCIAAGNDMALPWSVSCEVGFKYLKDGFEKGLFSESDLDAAVKRVLLAQHKVNLMSDIDTEPRECDFEAIERIAKECISAHYAEGVPHAIDKNGRHLFVILTQRDPNENEPAPDVPLFANEWFFPHRVQDMVKSVFPNSDCTFLPEYPAAAQNIRLFDKQIPYDSVVYMTSHRIQAYLGRDCLTERVLAVMRALQSTNRISAVLHFGNPHVMDDVPRTDRFILGYADERCVAHALKILAGEAEAVGTVPYDDVTIKL